MESAYANVVYVLLDNYPYAIREEEGITSHISIASMVIMKSL